MYNKHFGFAESPFNITPNSRFYFRTQCCEEILKLVQHGIASRKGIIVVTGEPGTGKTLLIKFLEQVLAPEVRAIVVSHPHADFETMLEVVLTRLALNSPAGDRTTRLERLTCHLIEQRSQGAGVCLLIDEAQDLDAHTLDELRLLANLEFQGDALLPIVLVGQPELNLKLDHPSASRIKQRVALTRTTHSLIRMEVEPYIRSRLEVAGYQGRDLFDAEAIDTIAAYSGGIPRLVNSLCDNSLIRGYAAQRRIISAEMVDHAARDLRITALFPVGRPSAREKWRNITSAPAPGAAAISDAARELTVRQSAAQLGRTGLDDAETAHDLPAKLMASMTASKKGSLDLSDSVRRLPELTGRAKAHWQGLPVALRCYVGAAGIVLVFLLLNIVSSSQLAVLYSSSSSPRNPHAGNVSSYSPLEEEETHSDGFREALFVSPSSPIYSYSTTRRIDIAASQPRDGTPGYPAGAPLSGNGSPTGAVKSSSSQLSRDEEPRAGAAAGTNRSEGAPKTVKIVAASLVRKRPSAGAAIISTLEPGSRVAVLARIGDFYQIRSLDKHPIRGYVHREDAFFERKK